ncbi:phosphopantetheine-binding protein [Amycolatopsis sp. GA6-003]|uniref:phosphopantetheine-binding protein n=1 Tax=Amycolatopsis sp. GA6-003 TaxID=2652444 RepID=UPI00391736F4
MEKYRNSALAVNSAGQSDGVEGAVLAALRDVLDVAEVAPENRFAVLGGDSLRAVRVLSRLWRDLGVELPVHTLRPGTTVGEFVGVVREHVEAMSA